jgi:thioredoxin 1
MPEKITQQEFAEKIFDYRVEKEWNYKGELPAIVDFYADWCGPCKMLAPVLEDIAKEYEGKLRVYKVNTDAEQEVAAAFNVQSIPTILFIPKDGKPQAAMGFLPKAQLKDAIKEVLGLE